MSRRCFTSKFIVAKVHEIFELRLILMSLHSAIVIPNLIQSKISPATVIRHQNGYPIPKFRMMLENLVLLTTHFSSALPGL